MVPRWWRLGIRLQLTLIVILGAALSTVATLFIADNAIQNYVIGQASTQQRDNMKIASLVLQTRYGQNVSIASDNTMVVDQPTTGRDFSNLDSSFGRFALNNNNDFVDQVQELIGASVSVYQCYDARGNFTGCVRIATTLTKGSAGAMGLAPRATNAPITDDRIDSGALIDRAHMDLQGAPREWLGQVTIDQKQYYADYSPIFNPQRQAIGIMSVAVPLDTITSVVTNTTIQLVLIGVIIMIVGIIFALIFASAIVNTLQRAANQVSGASERIGAIATQQASGAAQQVWAINAINQALQNFSEMARDISRRTDQLAAMGNQVLQRRSDISPAQIDSILAYTTRSVRDISDSSRNQAAQYERMTGAMQAVIEIAEQVAGNSQQTTESANRLDLVVRQLQRLVGVRRRAQGGATAPAEMADGAGAMAMAGGRAGMTGANGMNEMNGAGGGAVRTARSVRPGAGASMGLTDDGMGGMMGGTMDGTLGGAQRGGPSTGAMMGGARGRAMQAAQRGAGVAAPMREASAEGRWGAQGGPAGGMPGMPMSGGRDGDEVGRLPMNPMRPMNPMNPMNPMGPQDDGQRRPPPSRAGRGLPPLPQEPEQRGLLDGAPRQDTRRDTRRGMAGPMSGPNRSGPGGER